jgi:hypothetical protein
MKAHFKELMASRSKETEMLTKPVDQETDPPQLKESLVYQCKEVPIDCEPLIKYLSQLASPPKFINTMRANRRGYLGKWAIQNNELYLTEFCGLMENKEKITLEQLFPGKQIVKAEWFDGEIVLNTGKLLILKNGNRPAIYEKDLHLEFISGRLVNKFFIENAPDEFTENYYHVLREVKREPIPQTL